MVPLIVNPTYTSNIVGISWVPSPNPRFLGAPTGFSQLGALHHQPSFHLSKAVRKMKRRKSHRRQRSPWVTGLLNSLLGRFWKPLKTLKGQGQIPEVQESFFFGGVLNFFVYKFTVLVYFSHFACQKPGHKKWCNITTRQKLVVLWFNAFPIYFPGYFQGEPAVWGSRFALASNRLWPTVHAAAGGGTLQMGRGVENWWLENRSFVKSEWIVSIIFRIRLMEW